MRMMSKFDPKLIIWAQSSFPSFYSPFIFKINYYSLIVFDNWLKVQNRRTQKKLFFLKGRIDTVKQKEIFNLDLELASWSKLTLSYFSFIFDIKMSLLHIQRRFVDIKRCISFLTYSQLDDRSWLYVNFVAS